MVLEPMWVPDQWHTSTQNQRKKQPGNRRFRVPAASEPPSPSPVKFFSAQNFQGVCPKLCFNLCAHVLHVPLTFIKKAFPWQPPLDADDATTDYFTLTIILFSHHIPTRRPTRHGQDSSSGDAPPLDARHCSQQVGWVLVWDATRRGAARTFGRPLFQQSRWDK